MAQAVGAYLSGVQERLREAERQRAAAEARAEEAGKRALAERAGGGVDPGQGGAACQARLWDWRYAEGSRSK